MMSILAKIDAGVQFFRSNFDFKKADLYLRRFETLRAQMLDQKVFIKLAKIHREANTECTLRMVQSNLLEDAKALDEVDAKQLLYAR